jgi:hypothetical protein
MKLATFLKRTELVWTATLLLCTYLFLPHSVLAGPTTPTTYAELVNFFLDFITRYLIPTLFAFMFLYFAWRVIDAWIIHGGDEAARSEGRQSAVVAVVVFVVGVTTWGLVLLLRFSIFGQP